MDRMLKGSSSTCKVSVKPEWNLAEQASDERSDRRSHFGEQHWKRCRQDKQAVIASQRWSRD